MTTDHQAQVDAAREECKRLTRDIVGVHPIHDAIDRLAAIASAPPAPSERNSITLTSRQILSASQWAAPDGQVDKDQLDSEWTIGWTDGTPNVDHDLEVKPGYVMWLSDYPEEGCLPLDTEDEPTVTPPAPAASKPVGDVLRDGSVRWWGPAGTPPFLARLYTEPQPPAASSDAARDVLAERQRQISAEGWTPEHDDGEHDDGELAAAGSAYALAAADKLHPLSQGDGDFSNANPPVMWPPEWFFKPADPRRMLVKAGALILAEIERLDRAAIKGEQP